MFDFKYHIVSLVAVFLALGIGVVMGSMSAERGVITEQERALIATMEKDFEKLRASNEDLSDQLEVASRFQAAATALLTSNQLTGKKVAVVITGDVGADTLKTLQATLEQAGASQQSVTTFSGKLSLDDKKVQEEVASIVGGNPQGLAAVRSHALGETAGWIADGTNAQAIADLAAAGFLRMKGVYDQPVDAVVVIGGRVKNGGLTPEQLDARLIEAFKAAGVTVAGVETTSVKTSYMAVYQELGVSTVDDIDMPPGQVSVVYVLAGLSGDFGEKSTADALMPESVSLR